MQKNAQKVYAGYMGCSGVPMGEDQKYSAQEKGKKQKYQVYKIGLNPEKTKISYHKKSESMTQAKMKQLINKKEISFQKLTDKHQNPPYAAKLNKQNTGESLVNHAHHHSVALNSPQDHNIISSSTGSTRELKTVSNRVPKSGKSKTKSNVGVAKASPVLISKSSMHSKATDRMSTTETGRQMGHLTPSVKYSYAKAEMIQSYDHTTPIEYSTKPKTTNLHGQKPTYIILTIDNHGEKGYDRKKETPKSSVNMIATASYAKQGQSYQQLSSLKKTKVTHSRTKSDHILKAKPSINFLAYKKKSNASGTKKSKKASAKQGTASKGEKKFLSQQKPFKEVVSKHKRVRSDVIPESYKP